MMLGMRREGEAVVLYREKWTTLATALAVAGFMIGFSAFMFSVRGDDGASASFLTFFCLVFGGAGLFLMLRLPADIRKWFAQDGAVLLRADASGLAVAPLPGSPIEHLSWDMVDEIALAGTLKSVESDGTSYSWNVLMIFFAPRLHQNDGWFDLAKSGLGRTAGKRIHLAASYPGKKAPEVLAALRAVAPARVALGRFPRVVFDYKAGSDAFETV